MRATVFQPFDETERVYTGEEAKRRIRATIPQSAADAYFWDGGSFNGIIEYWAVNCNSVDECWSVVLDHSGLGKGDFQPWKPSRYAVVMSGPGFYGVALATPHWNVATITNGVCYELVEGDCDRMFYYAIGFDRRRVYYHYESSGFPCESAR